MVSSEHNLVFQRSPERWDEGLPLGNGLLGALIWSGSEDNPLKISLDRADLWDLRPVTEWQNPDYSYRKMREWVTQGRLDDLQQLYEEPYSKPTGPTKIPAGRIEIAGDRVTSSKLLLSNALAQIQFESGGILQAFVSASNRFGIMKFSNCNFTPQSLNLVIPFYNSNHSSKDLSKKPVEFDFELQSAGSLTNLEYPEASFFETDNLKGFVQEGWQDFVYTICVGWDNPNPGEWIVAWNITSTFDTAKTDLWETASKTVNGAITEGWQSCYQAHFEWWNKFWQQSSVTLPNKTVEALWYHELYKFGSVARRGAPPISLQAVWTADQGTIPPWKGDYHHDLNTQLSYWPCYTGNHLEEGLGFLDWLWQTQGEATSYTRDFFGLPGLNVPMTTDLLGRQMGGWHQYAFSATTSAWLAQHFYLHWRYSQDRHFLEQRAYPYLSAVCTFLEAITEIGSDRKRVLPLSSSPEINDNRLEAWFSPTTNYDLALIHWAFEKGYELALELNRPGEAELWLKLLAEFPDFSYKERQLLVAANQPLRESHRHFSHLMAIHPLNLIDWEKGEADQQTIHAALDELDRLGPDWWCGYSYAWLASLAARARNGLAAEKALLIFTTAFCSTNTFHLNGDQLHKGYSKYTYRPFTLEGNFAAAAGIQEMLLQSHNNLIVVFPAIPQEWSDVTFENFRAEGAFLVSATKKNSLVTTVVITAEVNNLLRLRSPFPNQMFSVSKVTKTGIEERLKSEKLVDVSGCITYLLDAGTTLVLKA